MEFRLATAKDIRTLKEIRLQMLQELVGALPEELPSSAQAYLEKHIPDESCLCAVLEINGEIIATAMLCGYEEMSDAINVKGKCAKLSSVYTLPGFRGRGYMEQLLLFLLEQAKRCGIGEIYAAAEQKAMSLYRKVGFQVAETIMFMEV